MDSLFNTVLAIKNLDHLQEVATYISQYTRRGDIIFLEGPLGAGKTTFSRFFIQSLVEEKIDVPSPTFNLVNVYETALYPLWHFDLYRLTHPEEIFQIGIEEALTNGVLLIEWPRQGYPLMPEPSLTLNFSLGSDPERFLEITPHISWQERANI